VPGLCRLPGLAGAGLAQPCPMACPWLSVTVRHQVERGLRAAAAARSRARPGSIGPVPRKTLGGPAISVSVITGAVW
jgi:hypothetical protein